jgi:prolyl-tRNA editing enzyme YbaK/EbsC (Cys-tRNA(Pro) deacylase)
MHPNAQAVQRALEALGVTSRVLELSESTRTSVEAASAIGSTVAQIAKSLVFRAGNEPVLVIASGPNRVSLEKVGRYLGCALARAQAGEVRDATGFPIGGVPPVGHQSPLRTLMDEDLFHYDQVWAAAGTPHAVFPITPQELARISGAEVMDLKEDGKK